MNLEARPILAYLDGLDSDLTVAAVAAALATQLGTTLILCRIVRPRLLPLFVPAGELRSWSDEASARLDELGEAVRNAEHDLAALDRSVNQGKGSRMVLVSRRPCSRVLAWIEQNPVAFVVGASYRRAPMARLVAPDVLDRVARSGAAAVMTLGFEALAPPANRMAKTPPPRRRRAKCARHRRLTHP